LPNLEKQLGSALFDAIASAQSWVLDDPRRKSLLGLCVDDWRREQWGRQQPSGALPAEVSSGGGLYPAAFCVDRYTSGTLELEGLKSKLLQFPSGTVFRWRLQSSNPIDAFSSGQPEEMFRLGNWQDFFQSDP